MKLLKLFTLFVVFFSMICIHSGFTWGNKKTLKKLVNSAPIIVFGKVLETNAKIEEYLGKKDFIFTYVTLNIEILLKGTFTEQTITIKVPGGKIGERVIGGGFRFIKDEEALLFLEQIDKNYYEVYSISGKLAVINTEEGKYFDCSLLKEDEVSKYGSTSVIKYERIVNRVEKYLDGEGGN